MDALEVSHAHSPASIGVSNSRIESTDQQPTTRHNQVGTVILYGMPIVSLIIDGSEKLCLAQISNTLLKDFSYNEIHNRRVALGITCVQCTPVQLEILRRAGAMPISSRRCGMISKREAERLCKSFLGDNSPPKLPDNFAFEVLHECAWGCRGSFVPSRYNSSRAKCIKCYYCSLFFSPNKFVFHSHRLGEAKYVQPDAANFNSWRRHICLYGEPPVEVEHAWEDVKAMFNGGTRKRLMQTHHSSSERSESRISKQPRKSPSFTAPPIKTSPDGPTTNYPSYFGSLPPLAQSYPLPVTQKTLDMRQSFVDYLWGSTRSGIPPIGLPYPLPWPKRPLPSFPPFSLTAPETAPNEGIDAIDGSSSENKADFGLRKLSGNSAFTPVSRSSPPLSPHLSSGVHESSRPWKREESKEVDSRWDDGTVFPDSSRASDDEAVDVENESKDSHSSLNQRTSNDEETFSPQFSKKVLSSECSPSSATLSAATHSNVVRVETPPSPSCQPSETVASKILSEEIKPSPCISSSLSPTPPIIAAPTFPTTSFSTMEAPFCLLPEEDPRIRLFLIREVEARRRMEVEMARLKYTYSTHFQPTTLHPTPPLHPSTLTSSALPPPHLPLSAKDWLDTTNGAAPSTH